MADAEAMLGVYLHLARASNLRRQPMIRDKLLILAGVQAQEMGLDTISALCRHKILTHNGRHLVGQWPTLATALADDEFQSYLKQLRRRYSPEKTEHMLHSLGIELGRERDAYYSDLEYAASLLDTKPDLIASILAQDPSRLADAPDQPQSIGKPNTEGPDRKRTRGPWTFERVFNLLIVLGPIVLGLLVTVLVILWQALFR
jgi:hypothetical protein